MKLRLASALFALTLPLAAQEPAADVEGIFYKAFWLEKGARDHAGAMALYEQFLNKAPEHKLAAEAARQQFGLLHLTGKVKERDAFKAKYEKLLGAAATPPAAGDRPRGEGRGEGDAPRGERGEGQARRMDPAARMAELEKQLAKAKEEGNEEEVKKLQEQIERMKQGGDRARAGQGRGGAMGVLRGNKKVAEMTDEELGQLKEAAGGASRMIEMMRQNGQEEQADKLEANINSLKKALDANNKEDAQKALDTLRESMPRRGGRGGGGAGGGGGNGGGGGGGGGNGGGGGGR